MGSDSLNPREVLSVYLAKQGDRKLFEPSLKMEYGNRNSQSRDSSVVASG